jgi:hypothetical protein
LDFSITSPFVLAGAEIGSSAEEMQRPTLLHVSVTPPRRKLAAARWFLSQFYQCAYNEGSALMFLEAFLTTLRSATFALQKMYAADPAFAGWYAQKQQEMRQDADLRSVIELRNAAEKAFFWLSTAPTPSYASIRAASLNQLLECRPSD